MPLLSFLYSVITLRCMVQFIGREAKYWSVIFFLLGFCDFFSASQIYILFVCLFVSSSGVFDSIVTIYREEGMLGFFA